MLKTELSGKPTSFLFDHTIFYVCYMKNTVVNVLNLFIFELGKCSVL